MPYNKILIIFFFSIGMLGQNSTNSSGGNFGNSNGSVSFSVGQIDYTVKSDSNYTISEGVQQPIEISTLSVQDSFFDKNITVFPNPTFEYVTLSLNLEELNSKGLIYLLFDANGKLVLQDEIKENDQNINMSNLTSSIYYLKLLNENKEVKVFKIIKK